MKKFHLLCNVTAILFLARCASYEVIDVKTKAATPDGLVIVGDPELSAADEKGLTENLKHYRSPRYLRVEGSSKASSAILSMGSAEALKGNLFEAANIFAELKGREKNGSVENNLAVISELSNDYKNAFSLYTAALIIDPANEYYRNNFYNFLNSGNILQKKKSHKKRN